MIKFNQIIDAIKIYQMKNNKNDNVRAALERFHVV